MVMRRTHPEKTPTLTNRGRGTQIHPSDLRLGHPSLCRNTAHYLAAEELPNTQNLIKSRKKRTIRIRQRSASKASLPAG